MADNQEHDLDRAGRIAKGGKTRDLPKRSIADPSQYRSSRSSATRTMRIAQNKPQALLKVTSYSKGKNGARKHANYISRKSTLELEDENGDKIVEKEDINSRLAEWDVAGFGSRKNSRDTANIVLGVPPGEDRAMLKKTVRQFAAEAFDQHRYLWVAHNDTPSPHVHVMVHLTNQETERKLNPRKQWLEEKRERFAEIARDHGIDVDASRAWERGRSPRNKTQQIEYRRMRAWDQLSPAQQQAKREAGYQPTLNKTERTIEAAKRERGQVRQEAKPWEVARQQNVRQRQAQFNDSADKLDKLAQQPNRDDRSRLQSAASRLRDFAARMRVQATRHQQIERGLKQQQQRTRERAQEQEPDIGD